jgi:hypothetical protein
MVLVFLVLFVLMPPGPVLPLLFVLETFVVHVRLTALLEPMPICLVLAPIPVVVVLVIRVVYPSLSLFLLMPLMIVLRSGHGSNAERRHHCRRQKQCSYIFIPTMHNSPPAVAH